MKINPIAETSVTPKQQSSTQSTVHFKQILSQLTSHEIPTDTKIDSLHNVYDEWQSDFLSRGISADRATHVTQYSDEYVSIMNKAVEQGGYISPQRFVSNLSESELTALQYTQGLANRIDPAVLSHEGALNLLLPPSHSQDTNNDGLMETGIAKKWTFPPRNAPMNVHNAWQESMEGLSFKEQLLASGKFLGTLLEGNIKSDGSGFYEPGDTGFNNPFASADYSYNNLVAQMLESLEAFKAQTPTEQYEKDKAFFNRLASMFSKHGVA
jgi:hypothetical protein